MVLFAKMYFGHEVLYVPYSFAFHDPLERQERILVREVAQGPACFPDAGSRFPLDVFLPSPSLSCDMPLPRYVSVRHQGRGYFPMLGPVLSAHVCLFASAPCWPNDDSFGRSPDVG